MVSNLHLLSVSLTVLSTLPCIAGICACGEPLYPKCIYWANDGEDHRGIKTADTCFSNCRNNLACLYATFCQIESYCIFFFGNLASKLDFTRCCNCFSIYSSEVAINALECTCDGPPNCHGIPEVAVVVHELDEIPVADNFISMYGDVGSYDSSKETALQDLPLDEGLDEYVTDENGEILLGAVEYGNYALSVDGNQPALQGLVPITDSVVAISVCEGVDEPVAAYFMYSTPECADSIPPTAPPSTGCPPVCDPDCSGKNCGGDGCDGSCGMCSAVQTCNAGRCNADGWQHFPNSWCTRSGRRKLADGSSQHGCQNLCTGQCVAVEWWAGLGGKGCYECADLALVEIYENMDDNHYPPHVFARTA